MLKVYKFGGALLKDKTGFEQLAKIMSMEVESCVIVVISAFGKTTSKLELAAKIAEQANIHDAISIVNAIFDYHIEVLQQLIHSEYNISKINLFIQSKKEQLLKLIRGISITRELTARTKDIVLSYGETIATKIITAYLAEQNIPVTFFDITKALVTDSNFGAAIPNIELTTQKVEQFLMPTLNDNQCIVTQGFIGATMNGDITTMGIESSNLTAAILAGILQADMFVIWSDVEGIRNADPEFIENTQLIKHINYEFAEYLANNGLKLIYHQMMKYVRQFNLQLTYRSGINPDGEYSTIDKIGDGIDYRMMIINSNIFTYSKATEQYALANDFPFVEYFSKNKKNITCFSPEGITFTSSDITKDIDHDLLLSSYTKIETGNAVVAINLTIEESNRLIAEMLHNKCNILHFSYNTGTKTARIYYPQNSKNAIMSIITKSFQNLFTA